MVNTITGERKLVESGTTAIESWSAVAGRRGWFLDCLYNGKDGFPSQEVLKTISEHPGMTYFKLSVGDVINV